MDMGCTQNLSKGFPRLQWQITIGIVLKTSKRKSGWSGRVLNVAVDSDGRQRQRSGGAAGNIVVRALAGAIPRLTPPPPCRWQGKRVIDMMPSTRGVSTTRGIQTTRGGRGDFGEPISSLRARGKHYELGKAG
jgi:hypothetical protein